MLNPAVWGRIHDYCNQCAPGSVCEQPCGFAGLTRFVHLLSGASSQKHEQMQQDFSDFLLWKHFNCTTRCVSHSFLI
jgi:hypothetical protein